MNLIVLGDYSTNIEKACEKCNYDYVNLSKLFHYDLTQVDYTRIFTPGKGEKYVANNSLGGQNLSSDAILEGDSLATHLFNICTFLARYNNVVLFVDVPEENILFYLKKNLNDCNKFIYNNGTNELGLLSPAYSEFLYKNPMLPYIFTKKSRIKNIISELENINYENHAYCYRPKQLGLDISMSSTGVAAKVVDVRGREKTVFGRIKTKRSKIDIHRMKQIREIVHCVEVRDRDGKSYIIDLSYATELCIEGGAFGAVQGAFRLGQYAGMFLGELYREGVNFFYVAPTSLKKIITGYGRAAKGLMEVMIKKRLDIEIAMNDDEADALCLLTCLTDPSIELKDENLD